MVKADLQIHSKYSSHALYMPYPKIMEKLKSEYPESSFFEGDVWWVEHIAIDGVSSPDRILEVAKKKELKAIAITDHNTFIGSIEASRISSKYGIAVLPAMEISTSEGELLAYGITEKIPFRINPKEAIKMIHDQGGVVAIPHPFLKPHPKKDFATIQEKMILDLKPDAIDIFSPIYGFQQYWSDFADKNGFAKIGTSDAHMDALVGTVWTEFPDSCKSPQDFIDAIKLRKTSVSGDANRKPILFKAAIEYLWKNGLGRAFIKF